MQGGPTPAGETSPQNIVDIPCLPDIQQAASNNNGINNIRGNTNNVAPDITEIVPNDSISDESNLQSNGNKVATFLLASHLIEVISMIFATFLRFTPQDSRKSNLPKLSSSESSLIPKDTDEISPLLLGIHLCILIIPFVVVTMVSLNWVLRVQDFSGKIMARLVCWVLHFFQSSLVWRFLKLQIAYDPGDLTELGMLRFIQLHIHILPFLVMHVAITLSYPKSLGIALSLALTLLLSVVVTITVSIHIRQNNSNSTLVPSAITQVYHLTFAEATKNSSMKHKDSRYHIVIGATTMCILWSRIVSLAALFCLHSIWAICLIFIHWVIAVVWLGFQSESTPIGTSSRQIIHRSFLGFLLLWDWHIFGNNNSSKICFQPQLIIIYYIIVASQNMASICAWYVTKQFQGISLLYTIVLTSVIVSQICALLLLTFAYLIYSPNKIKWSMKPDSSLSRKSSSLVTPIKKATPSDNNSILIQTTTGEPVLEATSSSTIDKLTENEFAKISKNLLFEEKTLKPEDMHDRNNEKRDKKYPPSLTPKLLSNHLHSSIYSYSNDVLQHTTKSERSSTDNGSFNSRNTNTLPSSGPHHLEHESAHRPHGSFSDSFSSLSCGTVNKVMTTIPNANFGSDLYANDVKRLKHRKPYHRKCSNKVLDQVPHKYAGVKEEQDESSIQGDEPLDRASFISLEKEISPPRVALVRATQRFQVVCTKCLYAHDPLLTKCRVSQLSNGPPSLSFSCGGELGGIGGSSSTGYPSDTELTTTIDTLSTFSADSHSTYTTWPVGKSPGLAKLLMKEKGGHDYVTAWLRHQQNDRSSNATDSAHKKINRSRPNPQHRDNMKHVRLSRRTGHRTKLRIPSAFVQDLETVV
ncbi:UNVERIFIED_CONTAM: hypothetical protein RMT77_004678 [Armadillidium vulgare]